MRIKASLLSALLLAGCNQSPASKADLANVQSVNDTRFAEMRARIGLLETRNEQLAKDLNNVRLVAIDAGDANEHLRQTFNGNVKQENERRVAAMTARGACGSDWVTYPGGAQGWRYRQCTLKDMR